MVGFDADEALTRAQALAGEELLVCAEYTPEEFQVLYLSDRLIEKWGTVDRVMDVGEAIHATMDDFTQRKRVGDIFPRVSDVYAFTTHTDVATFVRVLGRDGGLYLSLTAGAETAELIETVKAVIDETG